MTSIVEDAQEIGLRERKKQQTRTAIHEAAFRLIEEHGLEATTIEQICQGADVSTRTFFNYYPSKAAAAFEIAGTTIDESVAERFRAAQGGLVEALCDAIGSTAEFGPSHERMKKLMIQRPELLTTLSQMMIEVRGQYIALAAERAGSLENAELAVTLVMAALSRVMHEDSNTDEPLGERLRATVASLVRVGAEPLTPAQPSA
ncbi:MAG TPA: TetR/AcrR family transcriptional regulator [Galbitalea sp.]|jgi:AcrR family transcriptional regulator|nr:TetR/AcrR family transcriptional regulator [Galbitalea sp.]